MWIKLLSCCSAYWFYRIVEGIEYDKFAVPLDTEIEQLRAYLDIFAPAKRSADLGEDGS